MTTQLERIDYLERTLALRDAKDAKVKADLAIAEAATANAKNDAARITAAIEEHETVRRGSWTSYLLGKSAPGSRIDFAEIDKAIPRDATFPPGVDASTFHYVSAVPKEVVIETEKTILGKLLTTGRR
jgi:hypothetical protein